jgi:hypothetical protein
LNLSNSNFQKKSPLLVLALLKWNDSKKNGINSLTIETNNPYIVAAQLNKDAGTEK